jgi:hypothetical protein
MTSPQEHGEGQFPEGAAEEHDGAALFEFGGRLDGTKGELGPSVFADLEGGRSARRSPWRTLQGVAILYRPRPELTKFG